MTISTVLKEISKRCPKCRGTNLSSRTKWKDEGTAEVWHRCLDCEWDGRDSQTLPSLHEVKRRQNFVQRWAK